MTDNIKIKGIVEEDFTQYRRPTMVILFPTCTFKCDKENKCDLCQNAKLLQEPDILVDSKAIVDRYMKNSITEGFVFSGMEPFDSTEDVYSLLASIRAVTDDVVVIYTGYTYSELIDRGHIKKLGKYKNIILKVGRFVPNRPARYDNVLGVTLSSDNQFAIQLT